ncbi:hypothetical protein BD309DRAFT_868387 [Dichomitus squalens]|uniref:Uncharacterized protein n=1 Tax=Dichomitus squalens TaxID=114155 RepID=A0A4Q9PPQ5_9APHY|nr:hypothetical protein BD309DRAFT_868387 [Dichomitus squalens]TBU56246.1 hypothetical protein BD310DRAFT_950207 [Dichomitus squalens]
MPDLPGPPSSEDEREEHTPLMQSRDVQGDLTAMKTPRPPGAWLMTPAPSRQFISEPEEAERSSDTAPPEANSSADSGLATPPLTLSRAQTFPLQTPAPPGGWVATPAPATASRRRGSLLKVRFDLESETASEGAAPSAEDGSMGSEADPRQQPAGADASGQLLNGTGNGDASAASSVEPTESSVEPPPTPPSLRERIRKKSPSIRILDAYGREHVETEPVAQSESVPDPTEVPPPDARQQRSSTPPIPRKDGLMNSVATPRNRSGVRVVDAMGREIEEDDSLPLVDDESVLSNTPLSHNEALTRMRDTLSSMKQELSDADRYAVPPAAEKEQCRNAQLTRSKIAKSLQVAQSAESKFVNHAPFRTKIGNETSALLPTDDAEVRLGWSLLTWRSLACLILVQLLLLAIMYRYAHVQAKKIFLTTYYDSFNPDLYIYLLKPDTTNYLIPTCPSWSIFSVFGSLQRASWRGVFADAWESASCAFSSHLQLTWAGWHHAQDTVPRAWPPT